MWDQRFQGNEYLYGKTPNDFLKQVLPHLPQPADGKKVLSLGEGEGRNAVFLAQQGYEVTAVDGSAVGLEKAKKLATEKGVSLTTQVADLATFEMGNEQWDAIISIFCHLPPSLQASVHQKVEQALKPGGVFVLEAYRPEQLNYKTGGPREVTLLTSAKDLKKELSSLDFTHLCEVEREVIEGTLHKGLAAVVQLIAIKPPISRTK